MAARFWVPNGGDGGTGNWDAADTTHWSATSGGAGGASVPGASDDVTFDGSSGSGTVTVTATQTVNSITSGAHTGTINTNGQTINTGTWSLTGTATRTVTLGASAINLSGGSAAVWDMTTGTNLTLNANTSTITMNGSGSGVSIQGGSKTYYNIVYSGPSGNFSPINLSCTNLSITGTASKTNAVVMYSSVTVTGTLTINGNSSTNRLLVRSDTLGTSRTFTAAAVSISNADFRDITGAGAASWDLSAITGGSGNCGGNSGITFTTAATQTYTGGTGSWSDVTKWTSRVPLPQDDVSMSGVTGGTITADMPRLGKSIDWTGASGTPTWAINSLAVTSYGSFTLISGMSLTWTQNYALEGRVIGLTLTSAGKTLTAGGGAITIASVGGSVILQDALTNTGFFVITNGTYDTNNFSTTVQKFDSTGTAIRSVLLRSGTHTINRTSSTPWDFTTVTNLTFSAGTSTILISDTGASSKTFAGGGLTNNNVKGGGGGGGAVIITGSNTFNRIYTDGGGTKSITLPGSTTTTILSGQGLANGTNVITFTASAGSATISKAHGIVEWDYANLTNIPSTGGASFYAGANSTNGGGNTGWSFTAYAGGSGTESLTKSGATQIIHTDTDNMLNYWLKQQGWTTTASTPNVPPSLGAI